MSDPQKAANEKSRSLELLDIYMSLRGKERDEKFITAEQAAEITGLTSRTIRKWINEGKIESLLFGDKHHIWMDSLRGHMQYLVEHELIE